MLWGQGHSYSLFKLLWSGRARLISVSGDGECSTSMMGWYFSVTQGINLASLGRYWSQRWDNPYLGRKTHHFLMQPVIGILLRMQEKGWMLLRRVFLCKLQSRTIWADLYICIGSQSPCWALTDSPVVSYHVEDLVASRQQREANKVKPIVVLSAATSEWKGRGTHTFSATLAVTK